MVADSTKTPEPPDTPIHFLFYYEWKEKSTIKTRFSYNFTLLKLFFSPLQKRGMTYI